jgi:hypothetical protein
LLSLLAKLAFTLYVPAFVGAAELLLYVRVVDPITTALPTPVTVVPQLCEFVSKLAETQESATTG